MNDKKWIFTGLLIFMLIITFPFWSNLGSASSVPEPVLSPQAKAAKTCVASKEVIRTQHMQILNDWRNTVVREGKRTMTDSSGKTIKMSLSTGDDSCMGCHASKADFCDKCHNYASAAPYCWDCHIEPKEKK